jgi:hypothetical protein
MHRDVSVNNLMVSVKEPWVGVLIDLDLARDLQATDQQGASSLHRTGTLPFMALDLLHDDSDYPHYHRHDLESFVYVLVWIAGRYEDGREVDKTLFNRWCEDDWASISHDKLGFLSFSDQYDQFTPTSQFRFLTTCIDNYRDLLNLAHLQARKARRATTVPGLLTSDVKGKKRKELSDEGYADLSSGSKRKRQAAIAETRKPRAHPHPEELPGLNKDALLRALEDVLRSLGSAPGDAFADDDG